jgi:hypothetical protein
VLQQNGAAIPGYIEGAATEENIDLSGMGVTMPDLTGVPQKAAEAFQQDLNGAFGGVRINVKDIVPPQAKRALEAELGTITPSKDAMTLPPVEGPDTTAARTRITTLASDAEAIISSTNMVLPTIPAPPTAQVTGAIDRMASHIRETLSGLPWYTWGSHGVDNFAGGIRDSAAKAKQAAYKVARSIARILEFTRPDEGPLRNMHIWGRHLVENYSNAIKSNSPYVRRGARKVAEYIESEFKRLNARHGKTVGGFKKKNKEIVKDLDDTAKKIITSVKGAQNFKNYDAYLKYLGQVHNRIKQNNDRIHKARNDTRRDLVIDKEKSGKVTYETKKKQVIEIHLIAESPDGTVDRTELRALRKGIMDALALADLEHMVTVQ